MTTRFLSRRRALINALVVICMVLPFFLVLPAQRLNAAHPGEYRWPVRGRVIRGFEKPTGPYGEGGHQGLDIAAASGSAVVAAGDGTVHWTGELPRGRFVSISHAGSVRTTYLDLEQIEVRRGDRVRKGRRIGTVWGRRDDSSSAPHLHFGAYLHGNPVDPRLLLDGFDSGSFIRLCPVERGGGADRSGVVPEGEPSGLLSRLADSLDDIRSGLSSAVSDAWRFVRGCFSAAVDTTATFFHRAGEALERVWDRAVYPALSSATTAVFHACRWVWSNPYVQAMVAGLAAALVVIAVVVLAVFTLGLSLVMAVVAAIAATVACLGMAIYYAATSGADFSFFTCFMGSLSAGAVAAGLVVSAASLSGIFSAGWAKLGLWGTIKSAAWGGAFSAIFEAGTGYLFTGQFSVKKILVAFGIGAISGAVGKLLRQGLASRHLLRVFSFTATRSSTRIIALGHSVMAVVRSGTLTVQGFLVVAKGAAVSLGTRLAYMGFTGTFAVALNVLACALSGRSLTLSSALASFLTGVAMGGIALSFGCKGIGGLLSRLKVFQRGLGRALKGLVAKMIGKSMNKGLKTGLRTGFERLFQEKEVSK